MKATQRDFAGIATRAARQANIFFFCGPDEAGASAAATKILSLISDPGERVELSGGDVRKDPTHLGDEARALSLFGDSRHIVVRATGDEAYEGVKRLIDADGAAHFPVLIIATSATDKSRTAKLLDGRDDALVAMFWPPDIGTVSAAVRTMADTAGLRMNGDIAERIARASALDVRLAESEVEKLALYLDASPQSPRQVETADLDAVGARTEDDGFMPIVNAALSGNSII